MNNFFNKLMYGKSNKPDYTKEAIEKESKLKQFFDILGVKYGQLIKLNLLLLVFMLPSIFWTWWNFVVQANLSGAERYFYRIIYSAGMIPCLLILAAPLAGITYIIKNFTQDKHVWMWKDFVAHTKSNAKQAVLYMLVYSILLFIGQIILYGYTVLMVQSTITIIMRVMFIVIYLLFIVSAMYAYPMIVTYELKLKHVFRNSFLLTIGSLHTTFLAPVLSLVPFALLIGLSVIWNYGALILLLYSLAFGVAFALYIIISFTTAVFAKHLDPSADEANKETKSVNE